MSDTTFKGFARDLKKIADNLVSTVDRSMKAFASAVGTTLIIRTPKDTGRASINWIAQIDRESFITKPAPRQDPDNAGFLTAFGDIMKRTEKKSFMEGAKASAVANAYREIILTVSQFNVIENKYITFSNNLDYIELLAYYNHARKETTRPHAPPYWMIEQNLEENDYFKWFLKFDRVFAGV